MGPGGELWPWPLNTGAWYHLHSAAALCTKHSSQAVESSCGVFKFGRSQDKVCIKALVIKIKLIPFTWPPHWEDREVFNLTRIPKIKLRISKWVFLYFWNIIINTYRQCRWLGDRWMTIKWQFGTHNKTNIYRVCSTLAYFGAIRTQFRCPVAH